MAMHRQSYEATSSNEPTQHNLFPDDVKPAMDPRYIARISGMDPCGGVVYNTNPTDRPRTEEGRPPLLGIQGTTTNERRNRSGKDPVHWWVED